MWKIGALEPTWMLFKETGRSEMLSLRWGLLLRLEGQQ